jgi:hypothetical protein
LWEYQCHGSRAVIAALIDALTSYARQKSIRRSLGGLV